jgi:HK97 family phage portal protein
MAGLGSRVSGALRKAFAGVRFPALSYTGTYGGYPGFLAGTTINYAVEAGDLGQNAIVAASIGWIVRVFPEAPIRVFATSEHGDAPVPKHPLTALLASPNPYYNGRTLWQGTLQSLHLDGNAYWLKVRNSRRMVIELWYVPHTLMAPVAPLDGRDYLTHYDYNVNGQHYEIPVADVVHFRFGFDPLNLRKGLAPLASVVREVYTDNAAANYSAAMLRNMGRPFMILSPVDSSVTVTKEMVDDTEAKYNAKSTGDQVGSVLVMRGPTKTQVISFNPKEMALPDIREIPEQRISAVIGVPPIVAGLGTGLKHATYSNYAEAREAAYDQAILPLYSLLAEFLTQQLLPDLGDGAAQTVGFDTTKVKALQEDQSALASRSAVLFNSNIAMLNDARVAVGLPPLTDGRGDKFKLDLWPTAVAPGGVRPDNPL